MSFAGIKTNGLTSGKKPICQDKFKANDFQCWGEKNGKFVLYFCENPLTGIHVQQTTKFNNDGDVESRNIEKTIYQKKKTT